MSKATPQRIDPPSATVPRRVGQISAGVESRRNRAAIGAGQVRDAGHRSARQSIRSRPVRRVVGLPNVDDWLRLHAADLISRLQHWAADLDAREAQLNARTSIQEHRERRFRLRQQDISTEMAEQQRSIARLHRDLEAQVRRRAAENNVG